MDTLQVERADGVVSVTLNRPAKKNAINQQMWDELLAVFTEIGASTDDRIVVVSGAGGSFCSGADLTDLSGGADTHFLNRMRHVGDVCLALHNLPQPTIAKVVGVAAGAGANLAFGCDLVVAADDARFSEIFSRRGLSIDFGGSWVLPRLIGLHRAKELAFFADILSAKEIADIGLVNRVVSVAEIDVFVADWAARLAAGPPLALSMTKKMLDESSTSSLAQALEHEAVAQTVNFGSADTAEAMQAFVLKRDPVFRGR
ncbi:MAG: enoyl-CoA hydratase/isomerase family protein [Acidimicrobiales bacterium]